MRSRNSHAPSIRAPLAGVLLAACTALPTATPAPRVTADDLQRAVAPQWTGSLTYRDYSPPHGEVVLAVTAVVTPARDGIVIALHYPDEPHADRTSELLVSPDGASVDGAVVVSRSVDGDAFTFATEAACEDDDRPATCRTEYSMTPHSLSWQKLVTFAGDPKALVRHTYTFRR